MVDWWTEVGKATSSFLEQHGLLAAFVFLLIEEAGVPVPVPGDVLMLILGLHAKQGTVPLWQAIGATWLGTMIGSTFLYFAARIAGRDLVYRYGPFIRLTPERLDRAERWLKHHGSRAVFLGRLVPGLRIVTAVACGVFEVPFGVFFPAMSLGALLYIVVYTLLGYFLGQPVLDFLERIHIPFGLLGSLLPLSLILLWTYRARQGLSRRTAASLPIDRQLQLRAGAVAGGLATISSTLLFNVVINLAGNIAFNTPSTLVEETAKRLAFAFARELQPLLLFVAAPAYLAVGVLWGVLYSVWVEPRLPRDWSDWLKGLVFVILPLVGSLVVVMPLLGLGGFLGVDAAGQVVAVGELIRHAAYGVQLGLLYPIFRTRRPVRVLAHTPDEVPPGRVANAGAET
jgi:membrane protein DedA with SNARE-associated domain